MKATLEPTPLSLEGLRVIDVMHPGVISCPAETPRCTEAADPRVVVLSGGTFQNTRLLGSTRRRLEALGFRVLAHRPVPPNDGGISYGQAAVAAARLSGRVEQVG